MPLRGFVVFGVANRKGGAAVAVVNLDRDRLRCSPLGIEQQRLGLRRDLLGLGEDRLDRAGVLLAFDDLPRRASIRSSPSSASLSSGGSPSTASDDWSFFAASLRASAWRVFR